MYIILCIYSLFMYTVYHNFYITYYLFIHILYIIYMFIITILFTQFRIFKVNILPSKLYKVNPRGEVYGGAERDFHCVPVGDAK